MSYRNNKVVDAGLGEGEEDREEIRSEWKQRPSYAEQRRPFCHLDAILWEVRRSGKVGTGVRHYLTFKRILLTALCGIEAGN